MVLTTFVFDVPEGYKMRHSFYKVQTLNPDYVETRGRKSKDDGDDKVRNYNKKYYAKKKKKILEATIEK
jgi:hypothetical protein